MGPEAFQRRAVRQKLSELLREPLDRLANETRLSRLARWHPDVARELLRVFGLRLTEEQLSSLERVRDLLEAVESAGRDPAARSASPPAASASVLEGLLSASPAGSAAAPAAPAAAPPAPAGTWESSLPYEEARIGAAAVYCSDGRVGEQMDEFLHRGLALPRYDRLACPGGPAALAGRLLAFWECQGVEHQLRFLAGAHGLRKVVLIAHQGCVYYSRRLGVAAAELELQQRRDLDLAAAAVTRLGLEALAFYARCNGERVRFEPHSAR
jgi:hypothetical protein